MLRVHLYLFLTIGSCLLTQPTLGLVIPSSMGTSKAKVGQGWDSRNRVFRENCLDGVASWSGVQESSLYLDRQVSQEKLNSFLEASVALRMNLLLASGELKLTATHQKDAEKLRETLLYAVDYHGKDILFAEPKLNARGHEVKGDRLYAKEVCGDSMVSRVRTGGQLFIQANFDFYDEKIHNEWQARFKYSVLGISGSKTWQDVSEDVQHHSFVSFSATQLGGDPAQLAALLRSIDKTRCRLSELASCATIISRLLWYARTDEAGGFRQQIDSNQNSEQIDWNKLAILSYELTPYASQGLTALAQADTPQLNSLAIASLTQLADEKNYQTDLLDRAANMLKNFPLKQPQRDLLEEARDFPLRHNLNRIRATIDDCFRDPSVCPSRTETVLSLLEKVDSTIFILEPSFYSQCMGKADQSEFGQTIKLLLDIVKTSDCALAEQQLLQLKSFDLSRLNLVDISALRYLRPQTLDLSFNRIQDIRALNLLSDLERVNIRDNLIGDIHVSQRWPRLRSLNASFNRIGSVAPLAGLKQIRRLSLQGNVFADGSVLVPGDYDYLIRDSQTRCALERERYLSGQLISSAEFAYYTEVEFAPILENGQVRWVNCLYAVRSYEE